MDGGQTVTTSDGTTSQGGHSFANGDAFDAVAVSKRLIVYGRHRVGYDNVIVKVQIHESTFRYHLHVRADVQGGQRGATVKPVPTWQRGVNGVVVQGGQPRTVIERFPPSTRTAAK